MGKPVSVGFPTKNPSLASYSPATKIIAPANSGLSADYYTDGSNDDIQFQSAIKAIGNLGGGKLFIHKGNYSFSNPVRMVSNLTIEGAGIGETIITRANVNIGGGSQIFVIGNQVGASGSADPPNTFSNINFYDIEFNCNTLNISAIALYSVYNAHFERCYIHDASPGFGIYGVNSNHIFITGNIFKNFSSTAGLPAFIQWKGVQYSWITDNYFYNNMSQNGCKDVGTHASDGIYVRNGLYNHVNGNIFELSTCAFECNDTDTEFIGNTILNCGNFIGAAPILIEFNASNILIDSNTIDTMLSPGVNAIDFQFLTTGCSNIIVSNNIITGSAQDSISAIPLSGQKINGLIIKNNTIISSGRRGIFTSKDVNNLIISDNVIKNSAEHGMLIRSNSAQILNNRIYDDQTTPTQDEGIIIDSGITDCQLIGNTFENNTTNGIHLINANINTFITGNKFLGAVNGIKIDTSTNTGSTIIDNYFENNSGSKVNISGGNIGTGVRYDDTNTYQYEGENAKTIIIERNSTTNGKNLTIQAGGAPSGGTDLSGGGLTISGGIATGNGGSVISFAGASDTQGSGTTDRSPVTKMQLLSSANGRFIIGNPSGISSTADGLNLRGDVARTVQTTRQTTSNTAGNNLTINAGAATSAATNKSGGTLILSGGISTGSGIGQVQINVYPGTAGSTTDNTAIIAMNFNGNGIVSTYANIATAGNGIPSIYGAGRSTAQSGAVASVATYTVGTNDGSFIISANVNITAFTAGSFNVTVTYTDETNTSRTLNLNFSNITGTLGISIASAGAFEGIPAHIRAKGGTTITIATSGTFTSLTYNVEGIITQLA